MSAADWRNASRPLMLPYCTAVSLATIWRDLPGFTGPGNACGSTKAIVINVKNREIVMCVTAFRSARSERPHAQCFSFVLRFERFGGIWRHLLALLGFAV